MGSLPNKCVKYPKLRKWDRNIYRLKIVPCDCGKGQFVERRFNHEVLVIGKNCPNCGYEEIGDDFLEDNDTNLLNWI